MPGVRLAGVEAADHRAQLVHVRPRVGVADPSRFVFVLDDLA
jgi:hypothetical protein